MPWTIESALEDEKIINPRRLVGEYHFTVGKLETTVRIRLYQRINDDGVEWTQSHFIKTPLQGGIYVASRPWGDYEAYALHLAVNSIVSHYKDAISNGLEPEEAWLVRNDNFFNG